MPELFIYDEIGPDYWGLVSAKTILSELEPIDDASEIVVRINSPGGDVNEALAIYNALNRRAGRTIVEIDALAASAASYIAMAGDEIRIAENAMMMIHNAWTIALGDADELRKIADTLDKYTGTIAKAYAARSGLTVDDVTELMSDETWFTAEEAVGSGFADSVGQPLKVAANLRPGVFKRQPDGLQSEHRPNYSQSLRQRELRLLKIR